MAAINTENLKQYRQRLDIHCGISAEVTATLTQTVTGAMVYGPTETHTPLTGLADLSGNGYPLDGSRQLYDSAVTSGIGIRSKAGQGFTVTINSDKTLQALTIKSRGSGTISTNGISYELREHNVISMNAKTLTLTFTNSDSDERIEVESIMPGVLMEFDNSNLISCTLALRSDLTLTAPALPISDIEITAYWPDDIGDTISALADGTPIWYYSGYDGDYSEVRHFYLSEKAELKNKQLTLKGEDITSLLDGINLPAEVAKIPVKNARSRIYGHMKNIIAESGIKLRHCAKPPASFGTSTDFNYIVYRETTARNMLAYMMQTSHIALSADFPLTDFWPTYVDAGIPTLTHEKPAAKWTIYEKDCANVVDNFDRNIKSIKSADTDYDIETITNLDEKDKIDTAGSCRTGKKTAKSLDGFYIGISVKPGKVKSATANKVYFVPGTFTKKVKKKYKAYSAKSKRKVTRYKTVTEKVNKGTATIYGYRVDVESETEKITRSGFGITVAIEPLILGSAEVGTNSVTTKATGNIWSIFDKSNETGSFLWKGNPKMQPRDVFNFVRLNGTTEVCTIENITLTHSGGGTTADITYRKGVV